MPKPSKENRNSLLLQNGILLLADGSLFQGDLLSQAGRIQKIQKNIKPPPNAKKINVGGKLVIPGFVQTHVHLCQTLFRNLADDLSLMDWLRTKIWPMEGAHTEASLYASARLGIQELLAGGTTTILDMGTVRHTHMIFKAAEEMGIRGVFGKCLMDRPDCPPELRETTALAWKENLKVIETWHGKAGGRLLASLAPRFVLSCTEQLLRDCAELARDKKLLVHTHSSENQSEIAAVRELYGKENIEALDSLGLTDAHLVLAHCIWLTEREKKILQEKHVHVSHCPSSNLKLASGICSVPELRSRGISVSLGADGPPCNNNLSMFQEMRLASLIQKPIHGATAMTARETFAMATMGGAIALGLEKEIGSIETGKKADLVVIDLEQIATSTRVNVKFPDSVYSALVYAASPQNVVQTIVDGKVVYERNLSATRKDSALVKDFLKEQHKLLKRLN